MNEHLALLALRACIWEARSRKPGNVHPGKPFSDVTYSDFVVSASAIAPALMLAPQCGVGATILDCVERSHWISGRNTNLGIVLLLVPLAAVHPGESLRAGLEKVLGELSVVDAQLTYRAIRLAKPGGLGAAAKEDVADEPTQTLREVMTLAADRDFIARQYANGYRELFDDAVPTLESYLKRGWPLEASIVSCQIELLSRYPDSLIARKLGSEAAQAASERAQVVLQAGGLMTREGRALIREFDAWLREDGNRRNPGTTADCIAASLFILLLQGTIQLPLSIAWSDDVRVWC